MKVFPSILNVKNNDNFKQIHYNRVLCYLRKEIYEHIISKDENSYFEIDKFGLKYSFQISDNMINIIIQELNLLGWKCKLSFASTALFIYSTLTPPPSCWDNEF